MIFHRRAVFCRRTLQSATSDPGRGRTAIRQRALSLLPGTAPQHRLEIAFSSTASVPPHIRPVALARQSLLSCVILRDVVFTAPFRPVSAYRPTRTAPGLAGTSIPAMHTAKTEATPRLVRQRAGRSKSNDTYKK